MASSIWVSRRAAKPVGIGEAPRDEPCNEGARAGTLWTATIRGEPTVRRRMHEVVLTDGIARLVRSRPARLWQSRAMAQLLNRRPPRPFAGELALDCSVWSMPAAGEIDESLLVEVLERAAIIASGRQIRERRLLAAEDREQPRILVRLARFSSAG